MTTEAFESQANQLNVELTKGTVRLSGELTRYVWAELSQRVQDLAAGIVSHRPNGPGSGGLSLGGSSTRVSARALEEATRGNRDGVDLTNPAISRAVQKDLSRQGVTFAVTRHDGVERVHIGAGNAAQLEHAMKVAEQSVARQIERREHRAERQEAVIDAAHQTIDGARDRLTSLGDRAEERLVSERTAIRDALRDRLADLTGSREVPAPEFLPMLTLGIDGLTPEDNQARVGYAQAWGQLMDDSDARRARADAAQERGMGAEAQDVEEESIGLAADDPGRAQATIGPRLPDREDFPQFDREVARELVSARGDLAVVAASPQFTQAVERHLAKEAPGGVRARPLADDRPGFDRVKKSVNDARKHLGVKPLDDKALAKHLDLDTVPPIEKLTKGKNR